MDVGMSLLVHQAGLAMSYFFGQMKKMGSYIPPKGRGRDVSCQEGWSPSNSKDNNMPVLEKEKRRNEMERKNSRTFA